jgi:hypothetical protein
MLEWKDKVDGIDDVLAEDINSIANSLIETQKEVRKFVVDQVFDPESENAQSGKAVAEAIKNKADKQEVAKSWHTVLDTTTEEDISSLSISTLPDGTPLNYSKMKLEIYGNTKYTKDGATGSLTRIDFLRPKKWYDYYGLSSSATYTCFLFDTQGSTTFVTRHRVDGKNYIDENRNYQLAANIIGISDIISGSIENQAISFNLHTNVALSAGTRIRIEVYQ